MVSFSIVLTVHPADPSHRSLTALYTFIRSLLGSNVISVPADEANCGPRIGDESSAFSGRDGEWINNLREQSEEEGKKKQRR